MKAAQEKLLIYQVSKHKDPEAYSGLYDLYVDDIFRFIFYKVSNREQAEDFTSEVFLRTWQQLQKADEEIKNIKALFYRIARNLIIDHYRREAKQKTVSLEDQATDGLELAGDEDLLEEIQLTGDKVMLAKALQELKEEYREMIVLRYINEFSVDEIAEITGKTKGTIRVIIHRGIKALREILINDI